VTRQTPFRGLQKIFGNCIENNFIPKVIVICGNDSELWDRSREQKRCPKISR